MKLDQAGLFRPPFQVHGTPSVLVSYESQRAALRFLHETAADICGIGVFLNLFAVDWTFIVIACAVFTLGEMISMPISSAYVGNLAPDHMRGRYNGMLSLTWHAGHAYAPALGVALYTWQPNVLWGGSLAIGILAAAVLWKVK